MAQWARQFSGNNHDTRQEDVEIALREAIGSFKLKASPEGPEKVLTLAEKVVFAREHVIRTRLNSFTHVPTEEAIAAHQRTIDSLNDRLQRTRSGGVNAVLQEFGVPELIKS